MDVHSESHTREGRLEGSSGEEEGLSLLEARDMLKVRSVREGWRLEVLVRAWSSVEETWKGWWDGWMNSSKVGSRWDI